MVVCMLDKILARKLLFWKEYVKTQIWKVGPVLLDTFWRRKIEGKPNLWNAVKEESSNYAVRLDRNRRACFLD